MDGSSTPLLLTHLTWPEIREHLVNDKRLIVPIGACDQYGPHLPVGCSSMVAEAFARQLSEDHGVLRAPTLPYGVNVPSPLERPGTGSLREKTLHAALNDLLATWEDDGFCEFILLTVHDYDGHVEAIATVTGTHSRVRVIEVLNMDLSSILSGERGPEHGGEILTSLMLHLYPAHVRMERAVDYLPEDRSMSTLKRLSRIPADSPGSLGTPTAASAEKGRQLFDYISERVRTRVFTAEE
jgi:creatinine amidohydrolase